MLAIARRHQLTLPFSSVAAARYAYNMGLANFSDQPKSQNIPK